MNTEEHRLQNGDTAYGLSPTLLVVWLVLSVFAASLHAEALKPFPPHWGEPPPRQTPDFVEWPGGFGHGSGTVAKWIETNLAKDAQVAPQSGTVIYSADLHAVSVGGLPEDFLVLNGDFTVQEEGGARYLELPGTPLESFAVMFGPANHENIAVSARLWGTSQGRRYPTFALGANGLGGYRLKLAPAKRVLELFRGPEEGGEAVNTVPFVWQSGAWVRMQLRIRRAGESQWHVEGKAWVEGAAEPAEWMVSYVETKDPLVGRPFVGASPFSGTPIRFAGLVVSKAAE